MPVTVTSGLRVSYTDAGSGIAIVFVPGLAGSKEWFCYQSSGLSDHYRVISYDLRRARGTSDYCLQLLVDDLARFLTSIRVHIAVIVGHSFGGLIALEFAAAHPDRCLALVLASAMPRFPGIPQGELASHLMLGDIRSESLWTRLRRKLLGGKPIAIDESDPLAYLAHNNAGLDRATLEARLRVLSETDLTPRLPEIEVPVLVVAGSQERSYVLSGSQVLDQGVSDSTLEIFEGGDQFYFHTTHDQFNSLLADYLSHKIARL